MENQNSPKSETPISNLINKVSFPSPGEIFAVTYKPNWGESTGSEEYARIMITPFGPINLDSIRPGSEDIKPNRSYRNCFFKCEASDALRVVGKPLYGSVSSMDKPVLFIRKEVIFEEVDSSILVALGIENVSE